MKTTLVAFSTFVACAALLAGCGGGGGGGVTPPVSTPTATAIASTTPTPRATSSASPTSSPTGSATATPTATATATAAPTATATPTPAASYSGTVVDSDHSNAPLFGATVTAGTGFAYQFGGGYILTGVVGTTTTTAAGTFTLNATGATYLIVTAQGGPIAAHRPFPSSGTTFGTIGLPTANSDETSGFNEINLNRSKYGSGNGTFALTLDADMMICARAHSADMAAKGYFAHTAPGSTIGFFASCAISRGSFYSNPYYTLENIGTLPGQNSGPSAVGLAFADDAYIAEGPGGGHYTQVISKTNLFVGLGASYNGAGNNGNTVGSYFTEMYVSNGNAVP